MSVEKFLDELKFLLSDLPEEEREEALDFYRCYFEDAGDENLDAVMEELGSPAKVAYTIREGLKDKEDEGEFTETGYRTFDDIKAPATKDAHKEEQGSEPSGNGKMSAEERYKRRYAKTDKKSQQEKVKREKPKQEKVKKEKPQQAKPKKRRNPVAAVFLAILKILMTIAAICIVILLICAMVAILAAVISSIVVTVAFLVTGIGLLVSGAGLVGVAMIGIFFIAFAVFLLLLVAFVAFCKNGLAGGIRGITNLTGDVIHERKRKEAQ